MKVDKKKDAAADKAPAAQKDAKKSGGLQEAVRGQNYKDGRATVSPRSAADADMIATWSAQSTAVLSSAFEKLEPATRKADRELNDVLRPILVKRVGEKEVGAIEGRRAARLAADARAKAKAAAASKAKEGAPKEKDDRSWLAKQSDKAVEGGSRAITKLDVQKEATKLLEKQILGLLPPDQKDRQKIATQLAGTVVNRYVDVQWPWIFEGVRDTQVDAANWVRSHFMFKVPAMLPKAPAKAKPGAASPSVASMVIVNPEKQAEKEKQEQIAAQSDYLVTRHRALSAPTNAARAALWRGFLKQHPKGEYTDAVKRLVSTLEQAAKKDALRAHPINKLKVGGGADPLKGTAELKGNYHYEDDKQRHVLDAKLKLDSDRYKKLDLSLDASMVNRWGDDNRYLQLRTGGKVKVDALTGTLLQGAIEGSLRGQSGNTFGQLSGSYDFMNQAYKARLDVGTKIVNKRKNLDMTVGGFVEMTRQETKGGIGVTFHF